MQDQKYNFHGAEYVNEHEHTHIPEDVPIGMYTSLEEIAHDVAKIQHDGMAFLIWEKLQKTIKSGAYLQKDGTV